MMRPTVATVLSGRSWEPRLVATARQTGRLRVAGRAYAPEDLRRYGSIECVIVGSETAWLSKEFIHSWQRQGCRVVGLHPAGDQPGALLLAGADLVVPHDQDPIDLVHRIGLLPFNTTPASPQTTVTAVSGVRGSPGGTTVAMALGSVLRDSIVLDADPSPGLGPMFGLPADGGDDLTYDVALSETCQVRVKSTGNWSKVGAAVLPQTTITSQRQLRANVVVDTGLLDPQAALLRSADHIVLVVEASNAGIARAAITLDCWTLPEPTLVLNKVRDPSAVVACRYLLGLEPAAIIPHVPDPTPEARVLAAIAHLSAVPIQEFWASR
jgi:hypothetical protein